MITSSCSHYHCKQSKSALLVWHQFPSPKAKFAAPWARLLEEAGLAGKLPNVLGRNVSWWMVYSDEIGPSPFKKIINRLKLAKWVVEDDQWWFISFKNKVASALRARWNLSSESAASFFHSANTSCMLVHKSLPAFCLHCQLYRYSQI